MRCVWDSPTRTGPGSERNTLHAEATTRSAWPLDQWAGLRCREDDLGPFTKTQREVALLASSQHQEEVQAHLMTSNPWGPGLRGKGAAHRIDRPHSTRPIDRSAGGASPKQHFQVQHFRANGEKIFGWVVGGAREREGGRPGCEARRGRGTSGGG